VWSLIEGAPLSANRGDEPPEVPEAAIDGVRRTMDRMVGSYLIRRGKKRYCDKSLGTARYAELLMRVYPESRFVCMYRHPMDVISSGVEACPWGLNGYGFEPYIAVTPGNSITALANFWADNTSATLAAEERFADKCFRLRYEDLVDDPEGAAAGLFEFLGVEVVRGISEACFSAERERFGPADHKIWYTSKITVDSVGRGWSIPATMIAPHILVVVNDLAGKLGYLTVDTDWGTTEPPTDLRVPVAAPPPDTEVTTATSGAVREDDDTPVEAEGTATEPPVREGARDSGTTTASCGPLRSQRLGERLQAGLAASSERAAREDWQPHGNETFVVVAITKGCERPAEYWLVDLGAATVTSVGREAQDSSDWDIIGSAYAWDQVIDGAVNFSVALRSCQLRYCDNGDSTVATADTRISMTAHLLGLVDWQ